MQTLLIVGLLLALCVEIAAVLYLVRRGKARAAQAWLARERAALIDAPRAWSDPPLEWEAADGASEDAAGAVSAPRTPDASAPSGDDALLGKAVVGPRRLRRRR